MSANDELATVLDRIMRPSRNTRQWEKLIHDAKQREIPAETHLATVRAVAQAARAYLRKEVDGIISAANAVVRQAEKLHADADKYFDLQDSVQDLAAELRGEGKTVDLGAAVEKVVECDLERGAAITVNYRDGLAGIGNREIYRYTEPDGARVAVTVRRIQVESTCPRCGWDIGMAGPDCNCPKGAWTRRARGVDGVADAKRVDVGKARDAIADVILECWAERYATPSGRTCATLCATKGCALWTAYAALGGDEKRLRLRIGDNVASADTLGEEQESG